MKRILGNLNELTAKDSPVYKGLFERQMYFNQIQRNGTALLANQSYYEGLILDLSSKIIQFDDFDQNKFMGRDARIDSKVSYFEENILNGYLIGFEGFGTYYNGVLSQKNEDFQRFILTYGVAFFLTIFSFSILSIYLTLKIKGKIKKICLSFCNMSKQDYNSRKHKLEAFLKSLKSLESNDFSNFVMKNFQKENRKLGRTQNLGKSRDRKMIKKKKGGKGKSYFFNLEFPILGIITFYILQTALALTLIIHITSVAGNRIILTQRVLTMQNLIRKKLTLMTSIKQYVILGSGRMIKNGSALQFIHDYNTKIEEENVQMMGVFEFEDTQGNLNDFLNVYFNKIANKSLCEITPDLRNSTEMCTDMDNGIPSKGYIQSFIRISKFFKDTIRRLNGTEEENLGILGDEEFKSLEYMVSNVYYPSFFHIVDDFVHNFLEFLAVDLEQSKAYYLVAFGVGTILGWIFVVLGFLKIWYKLDQTIFGFQVLGIEGILHNGVTRLRFIEVYGLKNNYKF